MENGVEVNAAGKSAARNFVASQRRIGSVGFDNGVLATVGMNDQKRLNSRTITLGYQLHQAMRETADDLDMHTVILTGADPEFGAMGAE